MHDGIPQKIELDISDRECTRELDRALRLKSDLADPFDPEERIEPALLTLEGVRSIGFEGADYFLNLTVVEATATVNQHEGLFSFRFDCTGGYDNETFLRTLIIVAKDFDVSAV